MATKLESPVRRSIEHTIQGREVTTSLEILNGVPCLSVKLKGLRTGWAFDLRDIADYLSALPRDKKKWRVISKQRDQK